MARTGPSNGTTKVQSVRSRSRSSPPLRRDYRDGAVSSGPLFRRLSHPQRPFWTWATPLAGWLFLAGAGLGGLYALVLALALAGSVLAAVHHAEVIAHRVGEPFGTLVLAVAVTVIEVALVVSLMVA